MAARRLRRAGKAHSHRPLTSPGVMTIPPAVITGHAPSSADTTPNEEPSAVHPSNATPLRVRTPVPAARTTLPVSVARRPRRHVLIPLRAVTASASAPASRNAEARSENSSSAASISAPERHRSSAMGPAQPAMTPGWPRRASSAMSSTARPRLGATAPASPARRCRDACRRTRRTRSLGGAPRTSRRRRPAPRRRRSDAGRRPGPATSRRAPLAHQRRQLAPTRSERTPAHRPRRPPRSARARSNPHDLRFSAPDGHSPKYFSASSGGRRFSHSAMNSAYSRACSSRRAR